jgi:hypothetical protein
MLQVDDSGSLPIGNGAADQVLREALFQMVQAAIERPATINRLVDEVVAAISAQLNDLESRISHLEGSDGKHVDSRTSSAAESATIN